MFLSPLDIVLGRERALVVQPDIFFVAKDRLQLASDRAWARQTSSSRSFAAATHGRLAERLGWFAAYGVRECSVVLPFVGAG